MDQSIQILIPTYGRPQNIGRLMAEMADTDLAEPIFVAHVSDLATIEALKAHGASYVIDQDIPSGVNAANRGFMAVTTPWFVLTQDDIKHHPGWLLQAMHTAGATDAKVVGLNDGATQHSVAWLINREYVDTWGLAVGELGTLFHAGYMKNFADNELNDFAKARGVWAYAADSLAEHLHPGFSKAVMDDTYTRLEEGVNDDRELFVARRREFYA